MQLVTDSLLKLRSAKYVYYRNLNIFFFTVWLWSQSQLPKSRAVFHKGPDVPCRFVLLTLCMLPFWCQSMCTFKTLSKKFHFYAVWHWFSKTCTCMFKPQWSNWGLMRQNQTLATRAATEGHYHAFLLSRLWWRCFLWTLLDNSWMMSSGCRGEY